MRIRCAFRLVSRKHHCLERVLRKSFSIKKSINKIPFNCRITRGVGRILELCKPETKSRVCVTVSNSPNPSRVYIRLCKHGKRFLLLKYLHQLWINLLIELGIKPNKQNPTKDKFNWYPCFITVVDFMHNCHHRLIMKSFSLKKNKFQSVVLTCWRSV